MRATPSLAALRADGLRLARDRFLVGTALYIVGISVAMRWVLPWASRGVFGRWGFDLVPYHPLIVSHLLVQLAPLLAGVVGAFLLLETRESGAVKALLVTPVPLRSYLAAISAVLVLTPALLVPVEGALIGLGLPPWTALLACGSAAGLAAPAIALLVAATAKTKTEAFASLKVIGILPVLATGAYFLPEPLQWTAGIYPPYLAAKAYWVAEAGGGAWPLWVAGCAAVSTVWGAAAMRLFLRAARR